MTRKVFSQSETDKGIPNGEDSEELLRPNVATTAMKSWTHCVYKSFSGCFGRVVSMQTVKVLLVIVMVAMPILLSPLIQYALYRYSNLNQHTLSLLEAIVEQKMASHKLMSPSSSAADASCTTTTNTVPNEQHIKSIVDESVQQKLQLIKFNLTREHESTIHDMQTKMSAVQEWMRNAQQTMDNLSQYIDAKQEWNMQQMRAINTSIAAETTELNEQLQRIQLQTEKQIHAQLDTIPHLVSDIERRINAKLESEKQTFSVSLSQEDVPESLQKHEVNSEKISALTLEIARIQNLVNDTVNHRQWNDTLATIHALINATKCNMTNIHTHQSEEDILEKIVPTLQSMIDVEHTRFRSHANDRNAAMMSALKTSNDEVQQQLQTYDRTLESVQHEMMALKEILNNQASLLLQPSSSSSPTPSSLSRSDFTVAVVYHTPLMTSSKLHAIESSLFYFFTRKYDQNSLRPSHRSGDCTPLKQYGTNQTYIIFELRQQLHINGIAYEHMSPHMINNDVTSAPKTMSIEFSNDGFRFFYCSQCGILTYNASESQHMSQSFNFSATAETYKYLKLNVLENHGADW
eukprot:CAMPEP_0202730294 /NCGR_PEP_ID=MMETSP1385-20130828/186566_1 /ASSEMBLY_ACC=CAM_ASM_000861 /TAXON_ID=933848 /ORGANISM="Elphidium margaritaceum" /LENGTH=575 /DNA_ID=CAMNT_0049396567 /DNA_START=65 /DNA_END=1789 /DNA_ORIENTATION=+